MGGRGQSYFIKYRFVLQSGMLAGLVAVLAIPTILNVLICTRQSGTAAQAYRRYVRTMLHVYAWYSYSPDEETSKFWTSLKAVRYAHSRSGRASQKQGCGLISQKDMALTQFGFIGFITLGADRIDLYEPEFLEATVHMWRVIGYLLGIKDEYNICGRNWEETRPRLDIALRKVYVPALQNTTADFKKMTKALVDGLWPVNTGLSLEPFVYMTKRLARVPGYEYYSFDYLPNHKPDPQQPLYYKELGWWDRFGVWIALFIVTYLHKYCVIRWYLNFRVWLNEQFVFYFPYLAIIMFGIRNAYVRIFTRVGDAKAFEFHIKND